MRGHVARTAATMTQCDAVRDDGAERGVSDAGVLYGGCHEAGADKKKPR